MFCPVLNPQHVTEHYFNIICRSKSTLWVDLSPLEPPSSQQTSIKATAASLGWGCARGTSDAGRALVALGQGCWWPDEVRPGNVGTTSHQNPTTEVGTWQIAKFMSGGTQAQTAPQKGGHGNSSLPFPRVCCCFSKNTSFCTPHPQTLPPATSIEFAQNTVRNHKKKAGQMFSCTRVSGWERHVAVALVGGHHRSQFARSVCFGARMLLWDSYFFFPEILLEKA